MSAGSLSFSKDDSLVMKGMAIIAMLFHHVYFSFPDWVEPYGGTLAWVGQLGKVCVSIFLFCSGYGLAVQYRKVSGAKGTLRFLGKRLLSFYLNYWCIFLVFVPITVFAFHRPFTAAYGENVNVVRRVLLDLLGLQGFYSYNVTWWFNKLILLLYLFFPVIFFCSDKSGVVTLLISLLICRYWRSVTHFTLYGDLDIFQLPFVLGVLSQKWATSSWLGRFDNHFLRHKYKWGLLAVMFVVLAIILRMRPIIPHWSGVRVDALVTFGLYLLVIFFIRFFHALYASLAYLGRHSVNIYLMHTFINDYWHFHWLHEGVIMRHGLNLIVLLVLCLGASMVIEWLKRRFGLYKVLNYVKQKLS